MKSRFDALSSAADRRSLALFRCAGAGAVVLCLLTLNAIHPSDGGAREQTLGGDLLAMEIGLPNAVAPDPLTAAPESKAAQADSAGRSVVIGNELAFWPHYTVEPVGH